jgi:hypothetical protein
LITLGSTSSPSSLPFARLQTFAMPTPTVTLAAPGRTIKSDFCDARERELEPLEQRKGLVQRNIAGAIATVRLLF